MSKTISILQTPFQNLKFIAVFYRIMGLLSCKLIKGRLKPSACGRYYCALWILIHCAYSSAYYYYDMYMESFEEGAVPKVLFFLSLRFIVFIASLIPYNWVAIFQDRDLVMVNDSIVFYINIIVK